MRLVCSECKKVYDYNVDDFCPRCGAYNQPPKSGSTTAVIRKDGVNEQNHAGSFVHREVHQEKAQRRRVQQSVHPRAKTGQQRSSHSKGSSAAVLVVLVILWIFLQIFMRFF